MESVRRILHAKGSPIDFANHKLYGGRGTGPAPEPLNNYLDVSFIKTFKFSANLICSCRQIDNISDILSTHKF